MRHKLHKCNGPDCYVCNGGLASCEVCGGAEADLPYHCPGRHMTEEEKRQVANRAIDFRDGRWIQIQPGGSY